MDNREMSFWEGSQNAQNMLIRHALARLGARSALLFRPRRPLLLPLRVGPFQKILCPRTAQMRAAILHHHFAIDVAGGIRNQETREIGKLALFADSAERIFRCPAFIAALGPKLAGCA